jgi:hypothetical protein
MSDPRKVYGMFKLDVMETLWTNETWEECVGDDCKVLRLQYKGTTTKCFFDYFRPKLSKFIIHNQQPCGLVLGGTIQDLLANISPNNLYYFY